MNLERFASVVGPTDWEMHASLDVGDRPPRVLLRDQALLVIVKNDGACDHDLPSKAGRRAAARRRALSQGLIRDSGETRVAPNGKSSTVWVATQAGLQRAMSLGGDA